MSGRLHLSIAVALTGCLLLCLGCPGTNFTSPPVQTGFSFTNLSKTYYAAVGVREHRGDGEENEYFLTPLLAPGATHRDDFFEAIGNGCPGSVDLRLLLYRRVNEDVPIGLDPGEEVEQTPIVAGELLNVPYCSITPLVTFTIVNWEAPAGTARVKLAQNTPVDDALRDSGRFPNSDAAWEIEGVDPALADAAPPPLADTVPIAGSVVLEDGTPVSGVGVLLRTAFRVRLGSPIECRLPADSGESTETIAGYGDPIDLITTDDSGVFSLARPAGGYQVEFISDEHTFRPAVICVEAPISIIRAIAEECNGPCPNN